MARTLLVAALVALLAVGAYADGSYAADALGKNEVVAAGEKTPNTGAKATLRLMEKNGTLMGTIQFTNCKNVTMAHIHKGDSKSNGPAVAWLFPTDLKAPTKQPISGTFQVSFTLAPTDIANITDFMMEAPRRQFYFNVHSTQFPAGVVRGQIVPRAMGRRMGH